MLCRQERDSKGQSPGEGQCQGAEGSWRWLGSVSDFHIETQRASGGSTHTHLQPHRCPCSILALSPPNSSLSVPLGITRPSGWDSQPAPGCRAATQPTNYRLGGEAALGRAVVDWKSWQRESRLCEACLGLGERHGDSPPSPPVGPGLCNIMHGGEKSWGILKW